jgi:peptidyl-tRNA hydrolase, PTH1 family
MKIVIGLGNPGAKFNQTRHNAGFLALDHYLKDKQPIACPSKFRAEVCELHYKNSGGRTKVLFVKPQTFMNDSGQAVQEVTQFYKADPAKDLLIIHDDTDLPLGRVKVATDSSAAGHNGIKDIFKRFGTQAIRRIRIGVESRSSRSDLPTDAFVLQNFSDDELKKLISEILPGVDQEINSFLDNGQ